MPNWSPWVPAIRNPPIHLRRNIAFPKHMIVIRGPWKTPMLMWFILLRSITATGKTVWQPLRQGNLFFVRNPLWWTAVKQRKSSPLLKKRKCSSWKPYGLVLFRLSKKPVRCGKAGQLEICTWQCRSLALSVSEICPTRYTIPRWPAAHSWMSALIRYLWPILCSESPTRWSVWQTWALPV